MAKRKIDNLKPESTASEMEEAIKDLETPQTNQEAEPEKVEEVKEEVKPEAPVEEKKVEEPPVKEVTEQDEFGGDYGKLKKSYKESYAWNTRMAQDVAEMRKQFAELQSAMKQQTETPKPTLTQEQYQQWYDQDPLNATRWLARLEAQEQIKSLQGEVDKQKQFMVGTLAQTAINRYRSNFEDFSAMENDIKEELLKMPTELTENPQHYDRALELGYWSVKGRKLKEAEVLAREAGRKEAVVKTQAKKASFVEGSSSPAEQEKSLDLNKMTSSDLYEYMKARGVAP